MNAINPSKRVYENVIHAIGNTPIVKLGKIGNGSGAHIFVKLEFINPGGSIKDRIGFYLIEDAEKKGFLKPGGTIVEGTSGNTGFGLAIAAAIKGYHCVFVLPDKMSDEKIKSLRAFGARVVVTPTAVEPEDPRSYYSVSRRIAKETPNAFFIGQYDNLANRECHYKYTGPEIFDQMPSIDAFIAGIGTGGTICGTGKYLKEKKPEVKIVAVDPVGSLVYDHFKTGKMTPAFTYKIEGIGEDFIPANYDYKYIDDMVKVEDKESFLMTRELLTKEGLYCGISSGSAVCGALRYIENNKAEMKGKNILVILPDSGNRYLSKVFDDAWMKEAGFLDYQSLGTVSELVSKLKLNNQEMISVNPHDKISSIIDVLKESNISQVPVMDEKGWVKGIITEESIFRSLFEGKVNTNDPAEKIMNPSIEFISLMDSIEHLSTLLKQGKTPIVTDEAQKNKFIALITKIDLISFLGGHSS